MGYASRSRLIKIILTAVMGVLGIFMLLPFAWMLSASFKPDNEVFGFPIQWITKSFSFANYVRVWNSEVPFSLFFMNSLKITVLAVMGEVVTSALAGYSFAKIKFKGRDLVFLIYLSTLIFPGQMMLIPRFVLFREIGLYNTHWALILPGMFTAFGTFLLKQFFTTIPEELSESAKIDGASHWTIFTRIVIPLSTAAIRARILFQVVGMWNSYEPALIYLRTKTLATIPLGLQYFNKENATSYATIMAASVSSLVPIFIVFLSFQKQFVQGIATAGLKD
jgi:multiple sugar transport system permease protein